ncbi:MAG: alkaline phosphatase family protein [Chitinophagaceae bacterium]|nr:MAG: alkaline phosphatase family protein [Chitinophagaceae bacterium]
MARNCYFLLLIFLVPALVKAQLVSGPWAGNVELRNATIWAEVSPAVKSVAVKYFVNGRPANSKTVTYRGELGKDFNPVKIELNGLEPNTVYQYSLLVDNKTVATSFATRFTTKDLWQYRKPAPDFSFLAGSCAYFNEPVYDRPGKPYGADSSIFETMAKTPANFHIWMGDNWYTREVDYSTVWGLNYRASRDRAHKILQPFMAAMPQYAIWDDHDYGPNDAGKSYHLKEESRKIFSNYTLNPSYGEEGKGIYTTFSYSDVDFFLTDDRYFRSHPKFRDSVNGAPSPLKTYFGSMQMDWLQNALLTSNATFKIIVTGSQVLNPLNDFECMAHYSYEYKQLLDFLAEHKISGVVFFTGDRHHSEVIKMDRPGLHPLYDVTISPYTAGISKPRGAELASAYRVPNTLVEVQNFGKTEVTGKKGERLLSVKFIGIKGEQLGQWSVSEKELKTAGK